MGAHLEKKMDEVIGLFAAETISANLIAPNIISRSELQVCSFVWVFSILKI